MSDKPWQINCKSALLIPDTHQDKVWAEAVIKKEEGNYDKIIWMGDYFDSFHEYPRVATVSDMAAFVQARMENDNEYFLLGNHECHYMEAHSHNKQFRHKKALHYKCGGHSNNKSIDINKVFNWDNWRKLKMFYVVNGWLVSHAGFSQQLLKPMMNMDELMGFYWCEAEHQLELMPVQRANLLEAGLSRGGMETVGGPVWLDFEMEFVDWPDIKQICGHTSRYNSLQQRGESYCVDGQQTVYCLINEDGKVQFKSLTRGRDGFVEDEPNLVKYE